MSDISDLSSFDDTMSDPGYGNSNSPIEVSDFENMSEYEEVLPKMQKKLIILLALMLAMEYVL